MIKKVLILLLTLLTIVSCEKSKKIEEVKKTEETVKEEIPVSDDQVLEGLNKNISKTNVVLADTEGIYYEPLKNKWKIESFKFSVYELAYDEKKGILVGMTKEQDKLKGINVKDGKVLWETKIELQKPEKLEKKKETESKTEYITLEEQEAGRDNSAPSFAYDGKGTVIAAVNRMNKKEKWRYDITYFGINIQTGKIVWKKVLTENPWKKTGWALWVQKEVFFLGDPDKGPLYIIDQKDGEWYNIIYPKDESILYNYAGVDESYVYYFKSGPTIGFNLEALDKGDGSKIWEKSYPCRLRHAFYVGREIIENSFVCSKVPQDGNTFKHIDSVIKFNPKDGGIEYETAIEDRVPNENITKDMIYLKLSKDEKAFFVRSLYYFAKLDVKTGKVLWKNPLNVTKVNGIFVDDIFYKHEWVLGGDEAYDDYIYYNSEDGKTLWTIKDEATKQKANPGMPANSSIIEDWVLSFGDNVIRLFDKKDAKELWNHTTDDKIESIHIANGIFYLETQGIRKGFKIPEFEIWSYDRTKNETLLNNGWVKGLQSSLVLYNEDDFNLYQQEDVKKSRKYKIDESKLVKGDILTSEAKVNSLSFSNDGKYVYFSADDKKLTPAFKVNIETKKVEKLLPTDRFGYEVISKPGKKDLVQNDGKVKNTEVKQFFLKDADGKEIQLSDNEIEYYKFSDDNKKIFFVVNDNQHFFDEVSYKDLLFKVYDIEKEKFYNFYNIRKTVDAIRNNSIYESLVRYGDFGPNETVSFTIENMHSHKSIYTMKYSVEKPFELTVKINMDEDEIEDFNFPAKLNLEPTTGLEFVESEFNNSFFESLEWSNDSRLAYGEFFGLKYSIPESKNKIEIYEHLVTAYDWHPNGKFMVLNSGGNLYIMNAATKEIKQVTYYLPKREPKNIDDTVMGNKYRIKSLAFSKDGTKVAMAILLPEENLRRIVLVDVSQFIK